MDDKPSADQRSQQKPVGPDRWVLVAITLTSLGMLVLLVLALLAALGVFAPNPAGPMDPLGSWVAPAWLASPAQEMRLRWLNRP